MNLKVCNCCGKNLTNNSHYNMTTNLVDELRYTSERENIDLCPECYNKFIENIKTFKYGEDKIAKTPVDGEMVQNFLSREEFFAFQALCLTYSKNKRKLVKILNYFLKLIDTRIDHNISPEETNNIVELATKWEQDSL